MSKKQSLLVVASWCTSAMFLLAAFYFDSGYSAISFLAVFISIMLPVITSRIVFQLQLKRVTQQIRTSEVALELLKYEVQGVHNEVQGVHNEVQGVHNEVQGVHNEVERVRKEVHKDFRALSLNKSVEAHEVASSISHLVMEIRPTRPLNFTRSWMATPQFLLALYQEIKDNKPQTVLDIGSGMTTVISAYALRDNGSGKIVAWEHDLDHVESTRELIQSQNLSHLAQVEHRVLRKMEVSGADHLWFDTSNSFEKRIDLLIVDSPPGSTGPMARYPAIPLLKHQLSENAIIFLDDIERVDESKILEEWLKLLPNGKVSISKTQEKGHFAVIRLGTLAEKKADEIY